MAYAYNPTIGKAVQLPEIPWEGGELERGIEPPTCGLQNSEIPTSDNLTPRKIETQSTDTVDADGGLVCSVLVAGR